MTGLMGPVNSIYLPGMITFSHLAVKKWSLAWAAREQWRQLSTPFPRRIVRQFQSLYTPSLRGQLPRHIVTSVSVSLYAITARSITNQLASSGVRIGFTFLPHVIIPDKRHGVHWMGLRSLGLDSSVCVCNCRPSRFKLVVSSSWTNTFQKHVLYEHHS
jgi:hypothetical protein